MTRKSGSNLIPVNEPAVGQRSAELVAECLSTGWISSEGPYVRRFEEAWAERCGRRHGIAVSSGTAALELAVESLRLARGDEVIMPSFTIISCALAVVRSGGVPVLVDADPETWCMDVTQVEARVTTRTRAIMPVHIYGHPVDMDPLLAIAARHGLAVIEDAAEAHGGAYRGRPCGSFGDVSCFSFYANKIVTTGEGGMVLTDDDVIRDRARSLRNLCFEPERRFLHRDLGHNFRLTNLQAALGIAQLEDLEQRVRRKREIAEIYKRGLSDLPVLRLPVERPPAMNVYWMFGLLIDPGLGMDASELSDRLRELGVDTRPFFIGMHSQPALHDLGLFAGETYPVTDSLSRYGLYIPSGLALTNEQADRVVQAIHEAVA